MDVPTFDHRCDALPKGGIKMIFWDMGGEDELQCLWEKYVIPCVDIFDVVEQAAIQHIGADMVHVCACFCAGARMIPPLRGRDGVVVRYYQEAHGVVYVIDASDEARLRTSQESFEMMIRHHALDGVPLLVLANKVDLDGAMSTYNEMHVGLPQALSAVCRVAAAAAC